MRERERKSFLPWVFLLFGLMLAAAVAFAAFIFAVDEMYITDPVFLEWRKAIKAWTASFDWSDETWREVKWLVGIAGGAISASFTLLASWHFAEMRLPQRLQDLQDKHIEEHGTFQGRALVLARAGRVKHLPDIEDSRLVYARDLAVSIGLIRSQAGKARVLAASRTRIKKEADALEKATSEAQERHITALLIRGYQARADESKALKEFLAATDVRKDHILSRDIAAGWARGVATEHETEVRMLDEIVRIATARRDADAKMKVHYARTVRRRAELRLASGAEGELNEAREQLRQADEILTQLGPDNHDAQKELARVLTLFCEVQCIRQRVGLLNNQNGHFTRLAMLADRDVFSNRPEEPFSLEYTKERVAAVRASIARVAGGAEASEQGVE